MNICIFQGNLARDMELKYTKTGTALGSTAIAVNERYKSGDEWKERAHFFELTLWGKRAEGLQRYLTKGTKVTVQCKATQDKWQDNNGNKRQKVGFTVLDLEFAGGNKNSGGNSPSGAYGAQSGDGYDDAGDSDYIDDVPF